MRRKLHLVIVAAFAAAFAGANATAHGPMENDPARDLVQLVDRSNLIFIGQAQKIIYRNAQGDQGEDVIPYTIVTYGIDKVLRGKPPGKQITMRFVGGPDGRGRFLNVTDVPVVQEGDRDLLFVANTDDPSCPLVFCAYGRYRVLNEQVFDNAGSPVRAIIEEDLEQRDKKSRRTDEDLEQRGEKSRRVLIVTVISSGMPPKEFQVIRYPTPQFDQLIQNPEVAEQLKSQNISEDDARRRYETEAPKFIEVKQESPVTEQPTDVGPSGAGPDPGASDAAAPEALRLAEFIEVTQRVAKRSKRKPLDLRSVDPAARIVAARATTAAPQRVAPPLPPPDPLTERDATESKAFEQNGENPVIPKPRH
jgi:hypothetical protein